MGPSISSATSSSQITSQARVNKPEEYTTAGIVLKFFDEKVKDIAKAIGSAAFWTSQGVPNLPPAVSNLGALMGDIKNFISITEVPKKAVETFQAVKEFCGNLADKVTGKAGSWEKVGVAARKVFSKSTGLTSNVVDSVNFGSKFIPISTAAKSCLGYIGFAATVGSAGNGAVEQIEKFAATDVKETKKQTFYLINLARDVSFVALGVFGLGFLITATPVIGWVLAACSTAGLFLSLSGYFYEKVYDPELKGKNLNPEVVMENHMAARARVQGTASI